MENCSPPITANESIQSNLMSHDESYLTPKNKSQDKKTQPNNSAEAIKTPPRPQLKSVEKVKKFGSTPEYPKFKSKSQKQLKYWWFQ